MSNQTLIGYIKLNQVGQLKPLIQHYDVTRLRQLLLTKIKWSIIQKSLVKLRRMFDNFDPRVNLIKHF